MRRINYLFMLVMMMCMSVFTAQADKRYTAEGFGDASSAWGEGGIQEGVPCILQNALTASYDVLSSNQKSSYVSDQAVFVFEAATDKGEGLYRLKNHADGLYLEDPVSSGSSNVTFTESKARAFVFSVKDYENWPSDVIKPTDGEERDWTCATSATPLIDGAVVITRYDVNTTDTPLENVKWLQSNKQGSKPSYGNDYANNVWVIYAATQLHGADYINQVMSELYPEGRATAENLYDVGDQPGQISQDLYDELLAAYDAINKLLSSDSPSDEVCEAAYVRCAKSIENAKNGAVPVKEGYYYFRVNQKVDGNFREKNAAYDNGSNIKWSFKTDWELSETPNAADAKYIWHIIPNTIDERGGYFIQNVYTKRYVGAVKTRDTALPTTVEPESPWIILPQDGNKGFFTVESMDLISDPIIGYDGTTKCTAMHCPNWTDIVVVWTNTDVNGCAWKFMSVQEDFVKQIEEATVQYDRNSALQKLYEKANSTYESGIVYSIKGSEGTNDMSVGGLVTSEDQISSNAPDRDEGKSYGALLDGNPSTFFHSDWHGQYDVEYHSLAVDLKTAYNSIVVKMWRRLESNLGSINNGGNNPAPKTFVVYGSNSAMGEVTDSIGEFTCDWSTTGYYASKGTTVDNSIGLCSIDAPQAYRYFTLFVKERTNGGTNKFFNLGELRVYEGPKYYDASKSLNEAVPEAIRTRLATALAQAKSELAEEKATEATTVELQAAYDDFLANFPDPSIVKNLISEAKAQAEAADESTDDMGYFKQGAKQALLDELANIEGQLKDVMTVAEINVLKGQIEAALTAFNAQLIKPTDGMYVYIQSTSKSTDKNPPTDAYLCAFNNGGAQVKWYTTGMDQLASRPNYVWRVEVSEAGEYRFRNVGTGEYLSCPKTLNAKVTTSLEGDTCQMTLRSAKVAGSFNFVLAENLFANAQPNSNNLVVWNSASGYDNSAFQFIEAESYNEDYLYSVSKTTQIITLPVAVDANIGDATGKLYSVKGQTPDQRIYLEPLTGIIPAGTPFIFVPNENMSDGFIDFLTEATSFSEFTYVFTPLTVNGLVGTLAATPLPEGKGKIVSGAVAMTKDGETAAANSGYFNAVPQIDESEATDVYLEAEGVLSAIGQVVVNKAESADVYTLSGVKVRSNVKGAAATNGLPAGIYVVNGQKVLVK